MEPSTRSRKITPRNEQMRVCTHNGTFHCDEALACWMLKQIHPSLVIVRSREKEDIEECDYVVDVGAKFEHSERRYDHHHRDFKESMSTLADSHQMKRFTTKLSSAGLIYMYYGKDVLKVLIESIRNDEPNVAFQTEDIIPAVYEIIYENFIEEIDAVDNGVAQTVEEPKYLVKSTISERVAALNPEWNESNTAEDQMKRFKIAMDMVGTEMFSKVRKLVVNWLPARQHIQDAVEQRFQVHESGEMIELTEKGLPWKEHIFQVEQELSIREKIKYIISQDVNGNWKVTCVPLKPSSFDNRLTLPFDWRGLEYESLSSVVGIEGCVFVHPNGFVGGHKTKPGAIEMASRSLLNNSGQQKKNKGSQGCIKGTRSPRKK